jgi:hypothetical protein
MGFISLSECRTVEKLFETSGRLLNCAYRANGFPNKWWLAFAKRKFMNIVIL